MHVYFVSDTGRADGTIRHDDDLRVLRAAMKATGFREVSHEEWAAQGKKMRNAERREVAARDREFQAERRQYHNE